MFLIRSWCSGNTPYLQNKKKVSCQSVTTIDPPRLFITGTKKPHWYNTNEVHTFDVKLAV